MPKKRDRRRPNEYEFCLILEGIDGVDDDMIGKLLKVGCGDAIFGRLNGRAFADFGREADSFEDAVLSACRDIGRAGIGVTGFRLDDDDYVSQADIARKIGMSKQSVSMYASGARGPGGFPRPRVLSKDALYSWAEVSEWLGRAGKLPADVAAEAETRKLIQAILEFGHFARTHPTTVRGFASAIGIDFKYSARGRARQTKQP
jgi:hypothetical protein